MRPMELLKVVAVVFAALVGLVLFVFIPVLMFVKARPELQRRSQLKPGETPINTIRTILNTAAKNDARFAEEYRAHRLQDDQGQPATPAADGQSTATPDVR
jgi:hypothetical protein